MSSRRTEPRSIAAQLVLLFTLTATLLLFCGLGAFYWIVVRHAFAEDNAVLAVKISGLSADFRESGPRIFGEELKARRAGDHAPYWIRILDSEGHTVTETAGMERFVPLSVFPPAQKSTSSIGGSKDYRTGAKLFSLVAVNEKTGGQTYTIQVAQDRSSDEQLERRFGVLLIVMLAGSVSFSRSRLLSTRCWPGSKIPSSGSRSFPPISPTNCARPSPTSWARPK